MAVSDVLSDRTKTTVASSLKQDKDELYPDRSATDGTIKDTGTSMRLSDEVPRTTVDMSNIMKWEKGDEVRGTFAREETAMKNYRDDIEGAPDETSYKPLFINTNKLVSEELAKWK